ncbi:acyl carrier protein [Staphylococcus pseudintermedius]|nr:acyl carrier protein [Staphylococcus pseudintermedius]
MFDIENGDKDLRSLGLDSLGTIELLLDLEQQYNISFSDDLLVLNESISAVNLWNIINNIKKEC